MAQRTRFILILLAVAVIAFVLFKIALASRAAGLVSHGRHLSEWVEILGSATQQGAMRSEAEQVVLELGTNCFPYILSWIQSEDIPWRYKLPAPAARFIADSPKLDGLLRNQTESRIAGSHAAFSLLRTNATPAVIAELTKLMNTTNAPQTALRAASFLSSTGAQAIPSLVPVLENQSHPLRWLAVRLFFLSPDLIAAAQPAVPGLIDCLNDSSRQTDVLAAAVLGRIKGAPELTVPALLKCLKSRNPDLRMTSAEALAGFPEQAALSKAGLVMLLTDPDVRVRQHTTNTLAKIAPEVLTHSPGS